MSKYIWVTPYGGPWDENIHRKSHQEEEIVIHTTLHSSSPLHCVTSQQACSHGRNLWCSYVMENGRMEVWRLGGLRLRHGYEFEHDSLDVRAQAVWMGR
jgi:hypothetical protein